MACYEEQKSHRIVCFYSFTHANVVEIAQRIEGEGEREWKQTKKCFRQIFMHFLMFFYEQACKQHLISPIIASKIYKYMYLVKQ